jgi:tRNA(Ile)-lysidine synthase
VLAADASQLYHHPVRETVLQYIRERKLLKAGDRAAVAVSGGADSVALLRALLELRAELGIVLFVAHFNHQLRGDASDADEQFVAELAPQHDLPFFAGRADVRAHAVANKLSLEHAARDLRYDWLLDLAREQRFDAVATAHTADDQAETVLMKFLRGASTRGLAGIHPVLQHESFRIVRPLLETKRAEVEQYLTSIAQPWREDHTNFDMQHTRNRIRHELLPLLERDYNPNLRQLLSETAEIALAEEDYWRDSTAPLTSRWHQKERGLRLQEGDSGFLLSGIAVQRRTLRHFLAWHDITVDFHHVESVRRCALGDGSTANLPGGWQARRNGDWLELLTAASAFEKQDITQGWQYLVSIPGTCRIPEAGITLQAVLLSEAAANQEPPGSLLRAAALGPEVNLRNWQPGDRFRPAHSAAEEKLKRLFSEKRIPADRRPLWPVALSGSQIVWVRGFPVAHDFAWVPGSGDAVRIDISPAK